MEIEGFSFSSERSPSDNSEDFDENSLASNSPSANGETSITLDGEILAGAVVINTSHIFEDGRDDTAGPSINSFWLEEKNDEVELKTEPEDRTEEIDTEFLAEVTKKEALEDQNFAPTDQDVNIDGVLELDVSKSQSNSSVNGTIVCSICYPKYTTLLYTDADLEAHNRHYHRSPVIPEKPFRCFYQGCEAVFKLRTPWGKASFQYSYASGYAL